MRMLENLNNEDDGSISWLTDNDQENTDLENNQGLENSRKHGLEISRKYGLENSHGQGNNWNSSQIYPPRYGDNKSNHQSESDVDSREASYDSKFIRNFGAGADGGRQISDRSWRNNRHHNDDDFSHENNDRNKNKTDRRTRSGQIGRKAGSRQRNRSTSIGSDIILVASGLYLISIVFMHVFMLSFISEKEIVYVNCNFMLRYIVQV